MSASHRDAEVVPASRPRSSASDRELILFFQKGDEAAFVCLVKKYEEGLLKFAASMTGDPSAAQDIVQDVFLKLLKQPPKFYFKDSLRPWLYRLTRNRTLDYLRKAGRTDYRAEIPEPPPGKDRSRMKVPFTSTEVKFLLSHLPPKHKEVVSLRIFGGLTFAEIAQQTHAPLSTVMWRMRMSMNQLRDILETEGAPKS